MNAEFVQHLQVVGIDVEEFKGLTAIERTATYNNFDLWKKNQSTTAGQGSFRGKLNRRNKSRTTCDLCAEECEFLEATRIIDRARGAQLEEAYAANDAALPISANDACNGLLLCPNCHAAFDHNEGLLRIDGKGKIILRGRLKERNYRNLDNTFVPWAGLIGKHKDYPTKELLELTTVIKPALRKRIREIVEEENEQEVE